MDFLEINLKYQVDNLGNYISLSSALSTNMTSRLVQEYLLIPHYATPTNYTLLKLVRVKFQMPDKGCLLKIELSVVQ